MLTRNVYTSERVNQFHGFSPEQLGFAGMDSWMFGEEDYFLNMGVCNGYFGIGDVAWFDGRVLNRLSDEDYYKLLTMLKRNVEYHKKRNLFVERASKILDIEPVYLYRTKNEIIMQMWDLSDEDLKKFFEDLKLTTWVSDVGLLKIVASKKKEPELTPEQIYKESMKYLYEEGSSGDEENEEYQLYLKLKRKYEK